MRTIVKGKNVEVPDRVRAYAERKLQRIERILDDRRTRSSSSRTSSTAARPTAHIAEVTLVIDGQTLRTTPRAPTTRPPSTRSRQGRAPRRGPQGEAAPASAPREEKQILRRIADGTRGARRGSARIVKTKRFGIEPMFEEDAVTAMEELGHAFFIFVNAENEQMAVLYRATTATTA